jgi:HlyD family secretion protein
MAMKKTRHNEIRLMAVFSLTAIVFVAAGLWFHPISAQNIGISRGKTDNAPPTSVAASEPAKSKFYVVTKSDIVKELILNGELRAARSASIGSPDIQSSSNNTVTFLATEGSLVNKGDLLVEFDDSSLMSNKAEAERQLDEAKLNIEKKKTDLESQRVDLLNSLSQAQSKVDQDILYARIGKELLSANDYQKYQLNLQQSQLSLQKAQEQLDNFEKNYESQMTMVVISQSQAEIKLKKIENDSAQLKIYAPQDGIVIYGDNRASNRRIQIGDTLWHGMEVVRLPDLSTMQVIGYIYDTEYSLLERDMRCTVTLDALPGFQVGGKIITLTNVADRRVSAITRKVFQATIQLDRVDPQMKPGMAARVTVPKVLAKETPSIPRECLGLDSQGRFYVFKGNNPKTASIQFVKLGAVGDRMVQIASGLSPGDPLLPLQHSEEVTR